MGAGFSAPGGWDAAGACVRQPESRDACGDTPGPTLIVSSPDALETTLLMTSRKWPRPGHNKSIRRVVPRASKWLCVWVRECSGVPCRCGVVNRQNCGKAMWRWSGGRNDLVKLERGGSKCVNVCRACVQMSGGVRREPEEGGQTLSSLSLVIWMLDGWMGTGT